MFLSTRNSTLSLFRYCAMQTEVREIKREFKTRQISVCVQKIPLQLLVAICNPEKNV